VGGVFPPEPSNFIDLFFDFQRLEVVKFGLVGLESRVDIILAPTRLRRLAQRVPLENDDAAALVPCRQQLSIVVELHARDYVRCNKKLYVMYFLVSITTVLDKT